ncbi:MAG: hypothetical protein ACXABV_11170 [Candidatus Thorarchaeota archaeon]|jgi:hypothetical protein
MEIPVLTRFIKGLSLFFESKRLRWFAFVFLISAALVFIVRGLGQIYPFFATGLIAVIGGIFPTFFLIASFLAILGLQKFLTDEETYRRSIILFLPWLGISAVVYAALFIFTPFLYSLFFFWISFFGWIVLQAYLSSRTALGYAELVDIEHRSKIVTIFFGSLYLVSYFIMIGAFIFLLFYNPALITDGAQWPVLAGAILGLAVALGYNFLNGFLILRYRNKTMGDNLALLGLFISFYVAYFLYNVMKPEVVGLDLLSLVVDIAISIFFILYAMSSVGLTISARAELDTRWKISKELAATLTFFLASGYLVVEAAFEASIWPILGKAPDIIKLFLFPGVALLMALFFIRRAGRAPPEPSPMPEDAPVLTDDEELDSEEGAEPDLEESEELMVEDEPATEDNSD